MVIVNNKSLVYRAHYIEKKTLAYKYTNMLARVGLFRGTAQTVTVRRTQARSALRAAKHTHRHRTPSTRGTKCLFGPTVM